MAESSRTIVIVGGVAGGASAAARARRMDPNASIILLEKGPLISFANCGLPYHIGGEIVERSKLLVATKELFWKRFRIDVRTRHEALKIDRQTKSVVGMDHENQQEFRVSYDRLILATGAEPIQPPFWSSAENLLHLWTMEDMDRICSQLQSSPETRAVVIGGGFVGLELVEQFHRRGLRISLIERLPQVLPPLDPIFARMIEERLRAHGVKLFLSASVSSLEKIENRINCVVLEDGQRISVDLVVVGAGVRPRIGLASACGLEIGKSGGVVVNEWMQTSDPDIYAVGDIVEYQHGVSRKATRMPLAGPANRSGRVAGTHAVLGKSDPMGSVLGTSIVRVFDRTAACTGLNSRSLAEQGIDHRSVIIQAPSHASYYPGAEPMQLALFYSPVDGKILGAQAVGGEGVDKRIDIIATSIHFGGTVRDLAQLDLAYAPPFGSAKDPIHMAAFAACNDLDQHPSLVAPSVDLTGKQVLDVRTSKEQGELPLAGAIAIPVDELADRWKELDPNRETIVVCHSGKRAHVAACWLIGKEFSSVKNLSGGMAIRSLLD